MLIVVTGGLGFIGTEVIERLNLRGHEVICVDYLEKRIRLYEQTRIPILSRVYRNINACRDVMDPAEFLESAPIASAYIHLGACVDTRGVAVDLFEKNVTFTKAFEKILPYDARVVYASSASVYGNDEYPCNAYGMTKRLGEQIFASRLPLRRKVTCLRLFNVFGRDEHHKGDMASVPFKLAQTYGRGSEISPFRMFNPTAARDFVPVSVVADAIIEHAVSAGDMFEIFDVGRGEAVTFSDLDIQFQEMFGTDRSWSEIVDQPVIYNGRYQMYTRAGDRAPLSPYVRPVSLLDALKEQFKP